LQTAVGGVEQRDIGESDGFFLGALKLAFGGSILCENRRRNEEKTEEAGGQKSHKKNVMEVLGLELENVRVQNENNVGVSIQTHTHGGDKQL
jgi:hypothetical protein